MLLLRHKQILLVIAVNLLTGSVHAQDFDSPYCKDEQSTQKSGALYIKYSITDEWNQKVLREQGAPASVRGDELKELIIAGNYRYQRLYGKIWNLDENYFSFLENIRNEMKGYADRAEAGEVIPEEVFAELLQRMESYKPSSRAYPYDRISVYAPSYTLHYNRADQVGYGYRTVNYPEQIEAPQKPEEQQAMKDMIDPGVLDAARKMGKVTELKQTRSILGYTCKMSITSTDMFDYSRKYNQIEACTAIINGNKVDLYRRMGKAGEAYIMEATQIDTNYRADSKQFCAPQYVKFK